MIVFVRDAGARDIGSIFFGPIRLGPVIRFSANSYGFEGKVPQNWVDLAKRSSVTLSNGVKFARRVLPRQLQRPSYKPALGLKRADRGRRGK